MPVCIISELFFRDGTQPPADNCGSCFNAMSYLALERILVVSIKKWSFHILIIDLFWLVHGMQVRLAKWKEISSAF